MKRARAFLTGLPLLLAAGCASFPAEEGGRTLAIQVASLPYLAEVDARFQSYNIEMVELTGGRFWAPYGSGERYQFREPVDLADARLRNLASHLAPAFVRVSGTWANSTYVALDGEDVTDPPEGFGQVLQPGQWRAVIDFSRRVDAPIVTSFAASSGTRDDDGVWTTDQAARLLSLTRSSGGEIFAAEFINEPSLLGPGSLPPDYAAPAFARDFAIFAHWAQENMPDTLLLGPGNLGEETVSAETRATLMAPGGVMAANALLEATAQHLGGVSWHFYGGTSQRCGGQDGPASRAGALRDEWLDLTIVEYEAVAQMRDRHAPGKALWLTETAQAACGGSPWAAGFVDTFRYLNQLGALARRGVKVAAHNTLAASEYGLIDQRTLEPRPNYWGAVLWQRVMGSVVLDIRGAADDPLRLYAHCLPQGGGGVGILAINPSERDVHLELDGPGSVWVMQADDLDEHSVSINGAQPRLAEDGTLEGVKPAGFVGGISIPAHAIAFAARAQAGNPACM